MASTLRYDSSQWAKLMLTMDVQQIDIGEETGPRTVVSGLVHYIPIEQMRDKYLIAVVCRFRSMNHLIANCGVWASATSNQQICEESKVLPWCSL
jgi:Putative tRNA binding domain